MADGVDPVTGDGLGATLGVDSACTTTVVKARTTPAPSGGTATTVQPGPTEDDGVQVEVPSCPSIVTRTER